MPGMLFQDRTELRFSLRQLSLLRQGNPQIETGRHQIRIKGQCLTKLPQGIVDLSHTQKHLTQVVMKLGRFRLQFDGLIQVL